VVTRLSVTSGPTAGGTRVTITGTGFRHVRNVEFGTANGTKLKVLSPTKLSVDVPGHAAGKINVTVRTDAGRSRTSTKATFTYVAAPVISAISPATGTTSGGTAVLITGSGFRDVRYVELGATRVTDLVVVSSRELVIRTPEHAAGRVGLEIVGVYGSSQISTGSLFTYVTPPVVTTPTTPTPPPPKDVTLPSSSAPDIGGTLSMEAGVNWTTTPYTSLGQPFEPSAVAVDSAGDVFVANFQTAEVDEVTRAGAVSVIAGGGSVMPSDSPEPATSVSIGDVEGDVFVSITDADIVVEITGGEASVVAGIPGKIGSGSPGELAVDTAISSPEQLAVDPSGDLFINTQSEVFEVSDGVLSDFAGDDGDEPSYSNVPPELLPCGGALATDDLGDVYITCGAYVYKVTPGGEITTVAGDGNDDGPPVPGPALDSPVHAQAMSVDSAGNLFIGTYGLLVEISPVGALSIVSGDAGRITPATEEGGGPFSVAAGPTGDVYVTGDDMVEELTPSGAVTFALGDPLGFEQTVPGLATGSGLTQPEDVAVDRAGNVFVADEGTETVDKITPAGQLSIIASGILATAVATDAEGDVYVANTEPTELGQTTGITNPDFECCDVVRISPGGATRVIAGIPGSSGLPATPGPAVATSTELYGVVGIAVDSSGNLYIAELEGIEKVTPAGTISNFAGNGYFGRPTDGPATESDLANITGIAVGPDGDVYVSEGDAQPNGNAGPVYGTLLGITPAGQLTILAGNTAGSPGLTGVTVDSTGHAYVSSDELRANAQIYAVNPDGSLTTIAGAGSGPPTPGPAAASDLVYAAGLAVDAAGNLYAATFDGADVIKITPP
jgi:sugar lactone lactonase YvrE